MEGKGFHKKGKEAKACKGEEPLKNDQELLTRKTVFYYSSTDETKKNYNYFAESDTCITKHLYLDH